MTFDNYKKKFKAKYLCACQALLGLLLVASVAGVKRKPPVTWHNNLVRVARADSQEQGQGKQQGQGHNHGMRQGQYALKRTPPVNWQQHLVRVARANKSPPRHMVSAKR